jgi:uncharacterized protein HemX
MKIIQRANQGGSVAMFVIVGVILAAGLVGTVYFLKQHGQQVRNEQAIAAYDKQIADQKKADELSSKNNKNTTANESSNDSTTNNTVSAAQQLPTTGPKSVIGEIIGAGLLAISISEYLLSRRNLMRSL